MSAFLHVLQLASQFDEGEFAAVHPPALVEPEAFEALFDPSNLEETTPGWVTPKSVLFFPLHTELGDELVIGGSPASQVCVAREGVAIRHALLRRRPGGTWIVEDLRSGRGTSVDGRLLPPGFPMPLTPGAVLTLGTIRLQLLAPDELHRRLQVGEGKRLPLPEGANLVACCDPVSSVLLAPGEPVIVGRSRAGCGLVLPHPNVSREHASLVREGDRVRVVDLGSSNGTWVGPRRIGAEGAWVHPGEDPITIGPFDVRVLVLDGGAEDIADRFGTQRMGKTQKVEDGALSGTLEAMPLRQLVQAIEVNQRSGQIHIEGGTLVFLHGRPSWASWDQADGEDALLSMLSLRRGSFRFVPCDDEEEPPAPPSDAARIESTFTKLLLESTRIEDEGDTLGNRVTSRFEPRRE